MSIILQNLDWSQTQTEVFLNIPINGKKSLDSVVIAEKFLKINARPYFFELFFERSICVEDSSCKILESNIKFHLKKATDGWWSNLKNEILSNEQKKEIFSDYENKMKADYANQQKQRSKLNRNEIDKEIERESQIRQKINETETDLKNCQISEDGNYCIGSIQSTLKALMSSERVENPTIPPVRSCGRIGVSLSVREFITPKRESQENAERDWCMKQHEMMANRLGVDDKNFNLNECDVSWVLKKGYESMDKKNYSAAASAFSFGIKLSNNSPDPYLGRARAQYALQNYKYCAEDSSDALERLTLAVQSNLMSRIHCYWLRGKSLIMMGFTDHGEKEIKMAQYLDPINFEKNQNDFQCDVSSN